MVFICCRSPAPIDDPSPIVSTLESPYRIELDSTTNTELEQASGSGLVSHLNGEQLLSSSVFGSASSGATMNKPADVVVGK